MLSDAQMLGAGVIEAGAGVVQGTLGFGINTLAVPLLTFISIEFVPGPVIVASMFGGALVMWRERPARGLRELRWPLAGRIPGNAIGIGVLRVVNTRIAAVTMASMVLAAVASSRFSSKLPRNVATLFLTGVVSGVMGTVAGLGGVPMGLIHQEMAAGRLRATMSAYVVGAGSLSLIALAFGGRFGYNQLGLTLVLLPGVVVGYVVSAKVIRVADSRIRPIVLGLAAFASLGVIVTRLM